MTMNGHYSLCFETHELSEPTRHKVKLQAYGRNCDDGRKNARQTHINSKGAFTLRTTSCVVSYDVVRGRSN